MLENSFLGRAQWKTKAGECSITPLGRVSQFFNSSGFFSAYL
jgi:hypothetical protein